MLTPIFEKWNIGRTFDRWESQGSQAFCSGDLRMNQFFALNFYSLAYWLGKAEILCESETDGVLISSKSKAKDVLVSTVNEVVNGCELLGLRVSKSKANAVSRDLQDSKCKFETVHQGLRNLHEIIFYELGATLFFHLPADRVQYFQEPWQTFGQRVVEVFPGLSRDIEEAGKCYATKRNTACVFHLMRIMEHGLVKLAEQLDVRPNVPSWDGILAKIDKELRAKWNERSPVWIESEQYFSAAASHLRAVKTAWRNPTMHIESHYTDDEARDIYHTVQVFMKYLAEYHRGDTN